MNHQDGQLELALEFAQVGEQRGDLGGVVFIDPVQADERIEDEQDAAGAAGRCGSGAARSSAVSRRSAGAVMTSHGQRVKGHLGGGADALQALAHHGQGVFGGEEQHRAGAAHGELAQAGGAGGDADGQIQGQEAFAALGFAAQDADGLVGPEAFDQPLGLRAAGWPVGWRVERARGSWLFWRVWDPGRKTSK